MAELVDNHPPSSPDSRLGRWIQHTIQAHGLRTKFHIRGNSLHILCECAGNTCPDRSTMLRRLIPALQATDLNTLLPSNHPPIYQLQIYGCVVGLMHPLWTALIYLNQLDRHAQALQSSDDFARSATLATPSAPSPQRGGAQGLLDRPSLGTATQPDGAVTRPYPMPTVHPPDVLALALSNRSLARMGQETALASYLSETLGELGVAVRVSVKSIPYPVNASVYTTDPTVGTTATKRLWIVCEAGYNHGSTLIGNPVSQKLRELELSGYRDAVIVFQVSGETRPDWRLRVDLTPPDEMLREWARWGDVEALQRLLNQAIAHLGFQFSEASLKESSLHLFCSRRSDTVLADSLPSDATPSDAGDRLASPARLNPSHELIKGEITPLLETLAPQGIHGVALYGQPQGQDTPTWIDWLPLPAAIHPALAEAALTLAQQGDWGAITFLLHRLLNPNLDRYLATGGIRLQLLPKRDLVHIMSEAAVCPDQRQVGPEIIHFLQQLKLPNLAGVRVYGRRSGQKHPLWSYGIDLVPRERLVPEATPEFAATDTDLSELLPQGDGLSVLRPELTAEDVRSVWREFWQRLQQRVQTGLIGSQVFAPLADTQTTALTTTDRVSYQGAKIALIWGAVGILVTLQANWTLGYVVRSIQAAQARPPLDLPRVPPSPSTSVVSSTTTEEVPSPSQEAPLTPTASPSPLADRESADAEDGVFREDSFLESPSPPAPLSPSEPAAPLVESVPPPPLPYTPIDAAANQSLAASLANDPIDFNFNSRQFTDKLKLYYRVLEESGPPDVLVVGSSRALRGLDPVALQQSLAEVGYDRVTVFNFGVNGATAQVIDLLLRQILQPNQLPRLIVWADGARAFNSNADDLTFNGITASPAYQQWTQGQLELPTVPEDVVTDDPPAPEPDGLNISLTESYQRVDRWLSQQLATVSQTYQQRDQLKQLIQQNLIRVLPVSPDAAPSIADPATVPAVADLPTDYEFVDLNGFLSLGVQFNPATYYQKYAKVPGDYDRDYANFRILGRQDEAMRSLLDYIQTQQIPLIFVNLPMTDEYLDPSRLVYEQQFRDYMTELSLNQPGFTFRDLGERWPTEYRYFSDPSHLNRYGAYAVSQQIAQDPLIPWVKTQSDQAKATGTPAIVSQIESTGMESIEVGQ